MTISLEFISGVMLGVELFSFSEGYDGFILDLFIVRVVVDWS